MADERRIIMFEGARGCKVGVTSYRIHLASIGRTLMELLRVVRSKPLPWLGLLITWLLIASTAGYLSNAWAGDPGGDKTGVATDAQNAGGEPFVVIEPDQKDPDYAK
jgi:hypothetical protein